MEQIMPLRPTNVADTVIYRNAHGRSSAVKIIAVQGFAMPVASITATGFTTGGTLTAATYSYRIAYTRGSIDSVASTAVTGVVASGSTGRVDLSWTAIAGASQYKIYGRTGGSELLMATQAGTTFSDTGSATPSGALPTANANASFTVPHAESQLTGVLPGFGANQYANLW
jgi:hypothetical protein